MIFFSLVWTAVIQSSLESTGCPLAFHLNGSEIQFETIYTSAMCSSASVKHHGAAIHILQLELLRLEEQLKKNNSYEAQSFRSLVPDEFA